MKYKKCKDCDGTGITTKEYRDGLPYFDGDMFGFNTIHTEKCTKCKGTGKIKK